MSAEIIAEPDVDESCIVHGVNVDELHPDDLDAIGGYPTVVAGVVDVDGDPAWVGPGPGHWAAPPVPWVDNPGIADFYAWTALFGGGGTTEPDVFVLHDTGTAHAGDAGWGQ